MKKIRLSFIMLFCMIANSLCGADFTAKNDDSRNAQDESISVLETVALNYSYDIFPFADGDIVYDSNFENEPSGCIPVGWVTFNSAGYHLYGFNDDGSQFNYNWGNQPGGGGTRLYEGFSGDFTKAMYWGSRETNEGWCSFGEQVKDYILTDGTIDSKMPEEIALKLKGQSYQIAILMAAWKGEPSFTFTVEDLDGNVYARFSDILATPIIGGAVCFVSGSKYQYFNFTLPREDYYVVVP